MGDRVKAKWAKSGGSAVPVSVGEPDAHLTQRRLGRGPIQAYLRTKWHLDPSSRLATTHQRYTQLVHRCLNGRASLYLSDYCVAAAGADTR